MTKAKKDKPVETVIFDCGSVLTCDQDRTLLERMASSFGAETGEFERVYHAERREYDRGTETAREYWDRVGTRYGRRLGEAELASLVQIDMDSWFTINPGTVALVGELKERGYRLLVLSNMNYEGKLRLTGSARFLDGKDWLSLFDVVLLSCDLRLLKPERAIYEACLAEARAEPEACVFVDDNEENVLAARGLGIRAHRFVDAGRLRAFLAETCGLEAAEPAKGDKEDRP